MLTRSGGSRHITMPNFFETGLSKAEIYCELTAVEDDPDQMAELKTRVDQRPPTVATNFYHETTQSWKGAEEPFDTVLLFHCLYHVQLSERPAMYKKLFDNVVANGGLVFIIPHVTYRTYQP